MGINAWNAKGRTLYIVKKLEKSLDMGVLTFRAEKTACCRLQQQTKVHVLTLAQQTTL